MRWVLTKDLDFCLIIIYINSFNALKNGILFLHWQALTITNNVASLGMWTMLYLPNFIPTIDGTIGYVMSDICCQMVWHQIANVGPYTHSMLWYVDTNCELPCAPAYQERLKIMCSEHLKIWKGLLEMGVRVVELDLIPNMGSWNFPLFLLRDGSMTLMYMASLKALAMLCNSISTMK